MSFLNDRVALEEIVGILTNNGCGEEAIRAFRRVVDNYYAEGFQLDKSKFPVPKSGFYSFPSMSNVVTALPHRLCDTDHSWTFNCFDMVVVLADGQLKIRLQPDENYGPFMISTQRTNGDEVVTFAATPRDAFSRIYAEWYREASERIVPTNMQISRMTLIPTLFRWHLLPTSTTDATVEKEAWSALRSDWRRAGLTFPSKFQVLLYHKADLEAKTVCSHHAGLLLPRKTGYTYLEKAGGKGPFVRLDFQEKADILPWLWAVFSEREHQNASLFVTFNDTEIVKLDSK